MVTYLLPIQRCDWIIQKNDCTMESELTPKIFQLRLRYPSKLVSFYLPKRLRKTEPASQYSIIYAPAMVPCMQEMRKLMDQRELVIRKVASCAPFVLMGANAYSAKICCSR